MNPHYPSNGSALSPNGRFGRLSYLGWNMLMTFSLLIIIGMIAAFHLAYLWIALLWQAHPWLQLFSSDSLTWSCCILVLFYYSPST